MQITEKIHALKIPFQIPVGPGKVFDRFVYTYILAGKEVWIVDSGVKGAESVIFNYLKNIGRDPAEVSLLILTHGHPDHIGAAGAIKDVTGCRIAAHPDAVPWIEDVDNQFRDRPVPGFHTLVGGSTKIDRLLRDGELVEQEDLTLKVWETPGHARGSISLHHKDDGILFSGDAIPQADDLPIYEDVSTSVDSIQKLQKIAGLKHLLASWTEPLSGDAVYQMMQGGLDYLQKIHGVIREIDGAEGISDPMELCAGVVKSLGLPEVSVNPLVAKSFVSHLKSIDREKIY